jgi:type IV secretion system protein VirD4
VAGPARSGKSFHQTDSLLRWPGPAVVVDPKGEQWDRTAGWRRRHVGPVYRVPAVGLDLGAYYDLAADRDRRELFALLLGAAAERPEHRIFSDRNYSLLPAAVAVRAALGEHPLAVLARWARRGDPAAALREAQEHAPEAAAAYLGAAPLTGAGEDKFLASCWATFTTKLGPVADEIATLTVPPERGGVPAAWAEQDATVYLTYPLHEQAAAGPVVAALLVGLVRGLQRRPVGRRTLLSVDEAPAVALPRLPTWLATVGGPPAAVTCAVYTQSVPDLERVYGRDETRAILANCAHQVWFPPGDAATARTVSELLGERLVLERGASQSTQERGAGLGAPGGPTGGSAGASLSVRPRPVLTPTQAMALPAGAVVCLSRGLRFLAADSKAALWPAVQRLPPPPAPEPAAAAAAAADPQGEAKGAGATPDDTARWAALLAQLDEPPESEPDPTPDADPLTPPAADVGDVVAEPAPTGDAEPPTPTAYW